jgi:hypothetical protein
MKVLSCVLLTALVAATAYAAPEPISNHDNSPTSFEVWALQHGKSYPTAERRAHHLANWQSNVAKVNSHNAAYLNGEKTFYLAVNRLADLNHSEYKRQMLRPMPQRKTAAISTHRAEDAAAAPAQFNWIDKNVVTGIKDQASREPLLAAPFACCAAAADLTLLLHRANAGRAGRSAALLPWRAPLTCAT